MKDIYFSDLIKLEQFIGSLTGLIGSTNPVNQSVQFKLLLRVVKEGERK
jgi:hypothetical protein